MARRVFYSFHYAPDSWRASQVRNMGVIEGNRPATDNDWETVKGGGDVAIKRWIANQMHGCSCTVVLVGAKTATRKWIRHEIIESWNHRMGVVGICVHGLEDQHGSTSHPGLNPFAFVQHGSTGKPLSSIVKLHYPRGYSSQDKYAWIRQHLAKAVEEAISIRNRY